MQANYIQRSIYNRKKQPNIDDGEKSIVVRTTNQKKTKPIEKKHMIQHPSGPLGNDRLILLLGLLSILNE